MHGRTGLSRRHKLHSMAQQHTGHRQHHSMTRLCANNAKESDPPNVNCRTLRIGIDVEYNCLGISFHSPYRTTATNVTMLKRARPSSAPSIPHWPWTRRIHSTFSSRDFHSQSCQPYAREGSSYAEAVHPLLLKHKIQQNALPKDST
jgi:hypothetical protein